MNINQKALELLENQKFDESLRLFQQAVEESRNVQSLTNLACMYSHEEDDDEKALEFIIEAVSMNPSSNLPYNLLGEIYLRQEKWQEASDVLLKSIEIKPSIEVYNNLGAAKYHQREMKEASDYFLLAAGDSDYVLYSHVKCLIELGETEEAKRKLETFSEAAEEFVGELGMAELYFELGCYEQAIYWFKKSWSVYGKSPDWVSCYAYSLVKLNHKNWAREMMEEAIMERNEEIKDLENEPCDEHWTEEDKEERIEELRGDLKEYAEIVKNGNVYPMEFYTSIIKTCCFFGCKRHNHPEYIE